MSTVLAISDLHFPFAHRDALPFLAELKRKYRPDRVVCLGDEIDAHAMSDYDHDPDGMSAGDEMEASLEAIQPLYKLFPVVSAAVSNHTARPFRRAKKYGIPKAFLRDYRDWMQAPDGWWWEDSFTIDGVDYLHGEGFSGAMGALKCALARMNSVVIGHLHAFAGISWAANSKHLVFGMNCGWLGDKDAYAMAYSKHLAHKPVLGTGIVKDGLPTFVPMTLDGRGRWKGDL